MVALTLTSFLFIFRPSLMLNIFNLQRLKYSVDPKPGYIADNDVRKLTQFSQVY